MRRRGRGAVAIETQAERGLAMRILLHSPKDMIAGALAFTAVSAIIANALFLQDGRHPSPMFGAATAAPVALVNPLHRPRPVEADAPALEPRASEPKALESKAAEIKAPEPRIAEAKVTDPM